VKERLLADGLFSLGTRGEAHVHCVH
jgi:hypothetical protein